MDEIHIEVCLGTDTLLPDYASFTVDNYDAVEKFVGDLDLKITRCFGGGRFYRSLVEYGDGKVYVQSGNCNKEANDAAHVVVKGEGMRFIESRPEFEGWQAFAADVLEMGARFSRGDLAFDHREGKITPQMFMDAAKEGAIVTRARRESMKMVESVVHGGETFYAGSRESTMLFRCYNKALQLGIDEPLVRSEFQLMNERAQQLWERIAEGGLEAGAALCRGLLDVKIPEATDSVKSRWKTVQWWDDLVGSAKFVASLPKKAEQTILQAEAFLQRQMGRKIAKVIEARGGDVTAFVNQIVTAGRKKLTATDRKEIDDAKEAWAAEMQAVWCPEMSLEVLRTQEIVRQMKKPSFSMRQVAFRFGQVLSPPGGGTRAFA